ncbi:unnamed protein product [Phyllotreta striolata]|uniref:Death-inducer obliterator 1 n=1 Tax=Phyllotreta striolata TaxID=444603 RepID=A0A9N9TGT8_PHYSR|nr:unnamed protein product [Phyllotreta striolata]
MANSVVNVSDIKDEEADDGLLLLVGEDGTVTPDQDTVENYLRQRNGPTNLQIMKFNRSEKQGIDITVDNVTFIPDAVNEEIIRCDMDEVARNLYNFRLDHDYTPLTSPKRIFTEDEDELVKTLSILDGSNAAEHVLSGMELSEPPPLIMANTAKSKPKVRIIQSITLTPNNLTSTSTTSVPKTKPELVPSVQNEVKSSIGEVESEMPALEPMLDDFSSDSSKLKTKTVRTKIPAKSLKPKSDNEKEPEEDSQDEDYLDDNKDVSMDDDTDDSDFVADDGETKQNIASRRRSRVRSQSKFNKTIKTPKGKRRETKSAISPDNKEEKYQEKSDATKSEEKLSDNKKPEESDSKTPEKKPVKKEKKPPKPIPNDFALFSTPDIIRRVGGKEPTTPITPEPVPNKPAKIGLQQPRKSVDQLQSLNKSRKSTEDAEKEKYKEKDKPMECRNERRISSGDYKFKRLSVDEKIKSKDVKSERRISDAKKPDKPKESTDLSSDDFRNSILNDDTKPFPMDATSLNNIETALDASGLDLDPALLENLNNDEISEDILYQVAQSLVSNPEIQNAIDKGINDGVLDPMTVDNVVSSPSIILAPTDDGSSPGSKQIVRPDGRVVIIPPIERPTTRSRNKKTEETKPISKPVCKPLDEEHVSGNELDSSNEEEEEEEEEESEDDPNKLWCICNQPHNNRFMICCDTCEEWYHGKCVNISKSMGQQMESEGKEWICLFCKDPNLQRPQAAARRIRKASRNSRTSTDSSGSLAKKAESSVGAIPCVVCQKPSRKNSIYCSEECILMHAQGVERVVVFERSTGKMLTGNKAPSASNLSQWLKEHPGYEVVRSGGKVVTAKAGNLTQTKLKLVKNANNHGVSLAVQKKGGVNVGIIRHSPKQQQHQQVKSVLKASIIGTKQPMTKPQPNKESPKPKFTLDPEKASPPGTSKLPRTLQTTLNKALKPNVDKLLKSPPLNKEKFLMSKEKALNVTPKEKPIVRTPKPKKVDRDETTPQKPQENIRENVQKTVFEQLLNRLKGVEDLKLTEDEVKSMSIEIESQLYKCFGDTGQKYRNKYRSLIFNIKDVKNQTLWRRICEKTINPYELVRLSTDDMANQELAQWREKEAKHQLDMIKKSELELLNCNRQYVLKTHKGEQVVEDAITSKMDNMEVIKSLTEGSALDTGDSRRDNSKERDKKSSKHGHKDRDKKNNKDKDHRSHRSSSKERDKERSRRRSRSRDRKRGDRKKRSYSKETDRSRNRKSSHKSSRNKKDLISTTDVLNKKAKEILEQLVDKNIVAPLEEERLWKHVLQEDIVPSNAAESDSDHEPTSTVTIPTPPRIPESEEEKTVPTTPEKEKEPSSFTKSTSPPPTIKPAEIWRGVINMIDVAEISITAHEVSGDCSGLNKELSPNLDIVGRISPDTVWDYIGKMKCSNSKGISLIRLNATNMEEKMPYLALYSYLSSRDRLGVVKSLNKAVKDFYIYPLAPQKPIPQVLLPLNGPGFEESRPALLLGIIVRDKRKRPYGEAVPAVSSKKSRIETPPLPVVPPPVVPPPPPSRSYTPPPVKDPRLPKIPALIMPPALRETTPPAVSEGDEPYSPGDSSDNSPISEVPLLNAATAPPLLQPSILDTPTSTFTAIPGLTGSLPSSTLEVQRQIEELNKKIEMQMSEINSMTQNIVSASTEIGTTALANIALPTNLQQILDSIKSIGDTTDTPPVPKNDSQTDLTIPLLIPKRNNRAASSTPNQVQNSVPGDTIPLKLPNKPLIKPHLVNSPLIGSPLVEEKPSVLSSLTEEELIKKAAEMLGEQDVTDDKEERVNVSGPSAKRAKISLPGVPGLEDEET